MHANVIVVGAGSAGAVVARRLTDALDCTVLVLEAGPDYAPSALPVDLADGSRNSMVAHDWGYRHRPTHHLREFPLPRGRVVGGSSAVNTCIALRGQPEDYDEWSARGLPEWSWSHCLPAFKRLERDLDLDTPWHGRSGPLPLRRHPAREWVPFQAAFVEGCRELGFADCYDSNEPGSAGVGPHAMNKLAGRRISAAEAYLTPEVRARTQLTIQPDTLVRRLLFDRSRVVAVEIEGPTGAARVTCDQVVLCGGALNTPLLLLRSGVGPRAEVERLGGELVVDLPGVNRRLLDHPGTAIFLTPRRPSRDSLAHPLIQTVLRYAASGSAHRSDMLLQPGSRVTLPGFDLPLVSLMCSVGKPHGSGKLRWRASGPRAHPEIESHLLDEPGDRSSAVEAMQLAYELTQTRAVSELAVPVWPSAWNPAQSSANRRLDPRRLRLGLPSLRNGPHGSRRRSRCSGRCARSRARGHGVIGGRREPHADYSFEQHPPADLDGRRAHRRFSDAGATPELTAVASGSSARAGQLASSATMSARTRAISCSRRSRP